MLIDAETSEMITAHGESTKAHILKLHQPALNTYDKYDLSPHARFSLRRP